MTVRVVQSTRERIRIIEQQNVRVAVAFNGPPGRSGASASVSSDQGNILSVGQDGGIFAGYGAGFLFAQDDGPDQIVGLVDTILRNNSGVVQNKLKLPFNAATLLDANGVFWPRAVDDVYRLIVRVTAAPSVVNTDLTLKLDIGGVFGVIDTIRHRLSLGAGVDHQETYVFPPFTGSTFVANGGTVLAQADANTTIKSVDYRIFPESAG